MHQRPVLVRWFEGQTRFGPFYVASVWAIFVLVNLSPANASKLERRLNRLLASHRGQVGCAVKHLATGESFSFRGDEPMPTASLIKLPILLETYRQAHVSNLDLAQSIELRDSDKVPGSGVLKYLTDGARLTLEDAARLMIASSDNTATNLVIDRIGLPATNRFMRELGCPETQLNAKVFRRDTSLAPERSREFGLGSTTANEMVRLLERLASGEIVNAQASARILEHLYLCEDRTKIAAGLPSTVRFAHKTGAVARSRCDAGLIEAPTGQIALCVLTTDNEDQSWRDDNQANRLCAEIARTVYDHFHPSRTDVRGKPELQVGDQGVLVASLQRTLNARLEPSPEIGVDGDFGPQTESTVRQFQAEHGLATHGRVDAATWRALGVLVERDPPVAPPDEVNSEVLPTSEPDPSDGPPFVSARSWAVMDVERDRLIGGADELVPRPPASTTKIMTAVVVLEQARKDPSLLTEDLLFSERADDTVGSTSGLRAGEIVTVGELLYGLLLPSGNDASVALAEHVGRRLVDQTQASESDPYLRFVDEMNRVAKRLGMKASHFENPHGLTADKHVVSASDLAKLSAHAMLFPRFREIVATRQRGALIRSEQGYVRNVKWRNTNRLLGTKGYIGIKTGTTQAAGSCLVSCEKRAGKSLIVVVLGASSSDGRYVDSRNLYRWAWRQLEPSTASVKPSRGDVVVSDAARRLHSESLVVDGHNDLPWQMRKRSGLSFDRTDIAQPQPEMHTDIERLRAGGIGAQFWSVYVPFETSSRGEALLTTLEQIDFVHELVRRYPNVFQLALSHDDILSAQRSGKIASLIGVEGGHSIENSINVLRQLYARGARYMTLTHSGTLDWADSATDEARHHGLSPFGEEVVREMNRLGMLVDLSHVSVEVMEQALRISRAPVIFSHSSARAIADHPRNVPDHILRQLPENGGLVMINFYSGFVVPSSAQWSARWANERRRLESEDRSEDEIRQASVQWKAQNPRDAGTLHDVVDHIEHIIRVAGVQHVGLGADFDGVDQLPRQLEDVSTYPRITQALLDRGYSADQVRQVLGGNLMRVLKAAEAVRDQPIER